MKKVFLFLATAALFASCSDDLLEPNNGFQASNEKGITFQVVNDATRGMIDDKDGYNAFFFAEQDRIDIWSSNANAWNTTESDWSLSTDWSNPVVYKATKSQGNPNFTAINDDNLLKFKKFARDSKGNVTSDANFFVAYPTGQSVTHVNATKEVAEHFEITATDLSTQKIGNYMNMDKRLMYGYIGGVGVKDAKADVKDANASVGEKVNMTLKSPLSTILFKCEDVKKYSTTLGELQSITITSQYSPLVPNVATETYTVKDEDKVKVGDKFYLLGNVVPAEYEKVTRTDGKEVSKIKTYKKANDKVTPAPESVAITPDIFTYNVNGEVAPVSNSKGIVKRTATLTVGREINNGEEMNLFVLPAPQHKTGEGENYTISYEFKYVTLTYEWPTEAPLNANSGAVRFPFNIEDNFNYIVTKNNGLIVNSGKFSNIFKDGKVVWPGQASIDPKTFTSVEIYDGVKDFDDADWNCLRKLTGATKLIINNVTELKAITELASLTSLTAEKATKVAEKAFNASLASTLEALKLPLVTDFNKTQNITKFNALVTLELNAYKSFGTQVSPDLFFNDNTKGTLKTVNLSAVTSTGSSFGSYTGFVFTGYSALTDVTFNSKEGTKISTNQFKGCDKLQHVYGIIDMASTTAISAFEGCAALTDVKVKGTKIPANAFKDSGVKNIINSETNAQIVPTYVGEYAFSGNSQIVKLDLSAATTIGKYAFDGATKFTGSPDQTYGAVILNVTAVEENAFNGTAIDRFKLNQATKTGAKSLASTKLQQIWYVKDLAKDSQGNSPIDKNQVNKPADVEIFVNNDGDKEFFDGYKRVEVLTE